MLSNENSWILLIQILAAGAILAFLFFRRSPVLTGRDRGIQRIEIKLLGKLTPSDLLVQLNRPAQLVIHRFDPEPPEELFEIEEFNIYELLPSGYSTVINIKPEKRGTFPIVLGGEHPAGTITVE